MARTNKLTTTLTAFSIGSLLACSSPAMAALTTFGSDNDGYGGFTAEVSTIVPTPAPAWTLETDAARMTNDPITDSGQVNSSLLKQFVLDRTAGNSYTITGVLDWVSTYASDNNRAGILLFANTGDLAGADSGLSLQYNIGNGQIRILNGGVNGSVEDLSNVAYNGLSGAAAIGTTFSFVADVEFVGTEVAVDFTLIDENSFSQTTSATVDAANFTGEFFGFGTRGRVRNTTPGTNDAGFIYDAKSFEVVPEPGSLALLGLGGLCLMRRRASVSRA